MSSNLAGLPQRYLRTPEAARFVGLSIRTLEKHRIYGTGPRYSKLGGRVVYRVEDNTRWNFHPGAVGASTTVPRHAAFAPAPLNDAILAEVNSQRLATAQIMVQARTLSAALAQFQTALQQTKTNLQDTLVLRASVNDMKQRLDALESAQKQPPPFSTSTTTNEPPDPLSP